MALTKRERFLIFGAIIAVLIFVAIQFAILPMNRTLEERVAEYDELYMERLRVETKLATEAALIHNYERAVETFGQIKENYPVDIPNEEIAGMITELCHNTGFGAVLSLSLAAQRSPLAEEINAFSVVNVAMSLNGRFEAVRNLISAVENIEHIRISRISYAEPQNLGQSVTDGQMASNISVSFEVTVVNETERAGPAE
jgi:hypothetical protein